jgi:hypothetical protein
MSRIHSAVAPALVALLTACGSSDKPATTEPVKDPNVVGASGGTVSASGGAASLTIPAGALPGDVRITVTPKADPASDLRTVSGTSFEFGPAGTKFAQPVTLSLKYDRTKLPAGAPQSELRLAQLNTDNQWVPVTDGFAIDSVSGKATVMVNQLGESGTANSASDAVPFNGRASSAFSYHPYWTVYFPPVNPCQPVALGSGGSFPGELSSADCVQSGSNGRRTDFYTVATSAQSLLTVNISGSVTGPFGLQAQGLAAYSSASAGTALNTVVPAGNWMIFFSGQDSTVRGTYTIAASATPFVPRDVCEALNIVSGQSLAGRVVSGASSGDCSAVVSNSPYPAHVGQTVYYDFYRVRLFAGKTYTVSVAPEGSGNPCLGVWLGGSLIVPFSQSGSVTRSATITPTADVYYGLEVDSCSGSTTTWSPAAVINYTIAVSP